MKRNLFSQLPAAAFGWLLAFCAVACPVTGFALNAPLGKIALILFLFSALCGVCMALRHGILIPLGLIALWLGHLWREGGLLLQTQSLLLNITGRYNGAYGTAILCTGAENGPQGIVELPLLVLGCLAVLIICRCIARKKSMLPILLATLPFLIVCLVVTDTPPHPAALFGLLLGLAVLLLTDWSRRHSPDGGTRLLRMAALPAAIAMGILFLCQPQQTYVNHAEEFQQNLMTFMEKIQSAAEELPQQIASGGTSAVSEQVNLRVLGPRTQWGYNVMDVTSPVSGTLYLRGQDFNTYFGTGWTASRHRSELFAAGGDPVGTLTIETYGVKDLLYTPYYPAEDLTLVGGGLPNTDEVKTYSYTLTQAPGSMEYDGDEGISNLLILAGSASSQPDSGYRLLPTDTLRWARDLASQITEGCESTHAEAAAIAAYVRSSASYDLKTGRMDTSSYDDFAQWFLEESDTGYCVHFATAATVLLRAANIPARYVEGFLVQCEAGQMTTVTGKSAHAWAEYYADGVWYVLEATPADENTPETMIREESPPPESELSPMHTRENETQPPREDVSETNPGTEDTPGENEEKTPFVIPGWLKTFLWLLLAAAAVWAQSELRLRQKERAWNRGRPNEKALRRWAQIQQLSSLAGLPVPEELETIAQKAKFSQHTLAAGELEAFEDFREDCRNVLRQKGPITTFLFRLIFAVE